MKFKFIYFILLLLPILHLFFFQLKNLKITNPEDCLLKFKSNNLVGFLIFLNILIGKFF